MVLEIEKRLEEFSLISGETISIRHPEKDIIKVTDTKHNKVVGTFTREEFTTLMLRGIELICQVILENKDIKNKIVEYLEGKDN